MDSEKIKKYARKAVKMYDDEIRGKEVPDGHEFISLFWNEKADKIKIMTSENAEGFEHPDWLDIGFVDYESENEDIERHIRYAIHHRYVYE